MFFMFAFIALLTIIATCKWSNKYEKLYHENKTDTENESDSDNVNLGDVLSNAIRRKTNHLLLINFLCGFSNVIKKGELSTIVLKTKRLYLRQLSANNIILNLKYYKIKFPENADSKILNAFKYFYLTIMY